VACGISVLVIGLSLRVREAQSEVVPEVKLEMG
jgi:hypothetical protein